MAFAGSAVLLLLLSASFPGHFHRLTLLLRARLARTLHGINYTVPNQ